MEGEKKRLYKEIRYCRICNARFFATPGKMMHYYCDSCSEKVKKNKAKN